MTTSATVLSFFRFKGEVGKDWTQEELSEFYRVEGALLQGNMAVVTDRGLTDEGDPWFVFCRKDNGEVIAHFARIDRNYIIVSSAFSGAARGHDFRALIRELMNAHPLMLPVAVQSQKVFLHPAAMLVALVASSFLMASEKEHHDAKALVDTASKELRLFSLSDFAFLSAIAVAAAWIENQVDHTLSFLHSNEMALLGSPEAIPGSYAHAATSILHSGPEGFLQAIDQNAKFVEKIHDSIITLDSNQSDGHVEIAPPEFAALSTVNLADKIQIVSSSSSISGLSAVTNHSELSVGDVDAIRSSTVTLSDATPTSQLFVKAPVANGPSAPVDAYHIITSDIDLKGQAPILISVENLPVSASVQQAMSHVGYTEVAIEAVVASLSPASSTQISNSSSSAQVSFALPPAAMDSPPPHFSPTFITSTDFIPLVKAFLQATPQVETDIVGKNIIVVDKDISHSSNSNFGEQSWTMEDGSTVTIVGIIPHDVSAVVANSPDRPHVSA